MTTMDRSPDYDKRFFQISMLLPLAFPLAFCGLVYWLWGYRVEASGSPLFSAVVYVALIFGYSLYLGGIPYVLFLIGLFIWMRAKTAGEVQRMTYVAPLLFIPVFTGCAFIAGVVLSVIER